MSVCVCVWYSFVPKLRAQCVCVDHRPYVTIARLPQAIISKRRTVAHALQLVTLVTA